MNDGLLAPDFDFNFTSEINISAGLYCDRDQGGRWLQERRIAMFALVDDRHIGQPLISMGLDPAAHLIGVKPIRQSDSGHRDAGL